MGSRVSGSVATTSAAEGTAESHDKFRDARVMQNWLFSGQDFLPRGPEAMMAGDGEWLL